MRFLFPIFILAVAGSFALSILSSRIPCKGVIEYSLGTLDPRFHLSDTDARAALEAAEKPWEDLASRELFRYQKDAPFRVNFIFDERQQATLDRQALEAKEAETAEKQAAIGQAYDSLKETFTARNAKYEKAVASYEARRKAYEEEVERVNEKGGADQEEYERLTGEREGLQAEAKRLNAEQAALNALIIELNQKAKEEGRVVESYNENVRQYQEQYGASEEFDEGEYLGRAINIYEFRDQGELELVLAHEFGHALGLGHVENPESVMYYLMEKQPENPVRLSAEDQETFGSICKTAQIFSPENIREIIRFYRSSLTAKFSA